VTSGVILLDWYRLKRANHAWKAEGGFPDKEWFFYEGDERSGKLVCLNGTRTNQSWDSHRCPHEEGFDFVGDHEVPDEILAALAVYRLTGTVKGGVDA
jgi:hypothetical protein